MFKRKDEILTEEAEKYRHRTWILFLFTMFLGLIIIVLCIFIYFLDKHWTYKQALIRPHTKVSSLDRNNFTGKELLEVTNMRPIYLAGSIND